MRSRAGCLFCVPDSLFGLELDRELLHKKTETKSNWYREDEHKQNYILNVKTIIRISQEKQWKEPDRISSLVLSSFKSLSLQTYWRQNQFLLHLIFVQNRHDIRARRADTRIISKLTQLLYYINYIISRRYWWRELLCDTDEETIVMLLDSQKLLTVRHHLRKGGL